MSSEGHLHCLLSGGNPVGGIAVLPTVFIFREALTDSDCGSVL